MVNWTVLFDTNSQVMQNFAKGQASRRDVESALKFTDAAGEFRRVVRARGTNMTRTLARKALNRRS
jgi:hypothetical protein